MMSGAGIRGREAFARVCVDNPPDFLHTASMRSAFRLSTTFLSALYSSEPLPCVRSPAPNTNL